MLAGGIGGAVMLWIWLLQAGQHPSFATLAVISCVQTVFMGFAYVTWMASFTETVEAHNPALTATGLAIWGWLVRIVVTACFLCLPRVVRSVTPLIEAPYYMAAYQQALANHVTPSAPLIEALDDQGCRRRGTRRVAGMVLDLHRGCGGIHRHDLRDARALEPGGGTSRRGGARRGCGARASRPARQLRTKEFVSDHCRNAMFHRLFLTMLTMAHPDEGGIRIRGLSNLSAETIARRCHRVRQGNRPAYKST